MRHHRPRVQLPQPRAELYEWQLEGACRAMPLSMFFPARGLRGHTLARTERSAKLVCAQCPVIEQCRRHALETGEPYGIWGGLTSSERHRRTSNYVDASVAGPALEPTTRIGPPRRPYKKPQRPSTA